MKLVQSYMTKNRCYTSGKRIDVKGIVVHSTGVAQPDVNVFLKGWNSEKVTKCVHAFVSKDCITQTLPWNYHGWHAGGSANSTHIGFEILEPAGHTYTNGATMVGYDVERNKPYFEAVYANAVELCAMLCEKYNLDPIKNIVCHSEAAKLGIASNHADVMHWFPKHNKTMDDFRNDVKDKMKENSDSTSSGNTSSENSASGNTSVYYRVQIGSFTSKSNADTLKNKAEKAGLTVAVVKDNSNYVVRIGSFTNKDYAIAMKEKAEKLGFVAAIVRTESSSASSSGSSSSGSSSSSTGSTSSSYKVKVTASVLNVRSGASTSNKIVTTVKKDEVYTIVEEKDNWGKLKSGAGWISLKYTTKA